MPDQSANIQSIAAIDDFRAGYIQIVDVLSAALSAAESDMNRRAGWLERDRIQYWKREIRKRQEKVDQAKNALRTKQLKPDDSDDPMPSFVDEKKAIDQAQKRVFEAEEKLATTKQWVRQLERESQQFQGVIRRLQDNLSLNSPRLLMKLDRSRDALVKYIQTEQPDSHLIDAALREANQVASSSRRIARPAPQASEHDIKFAQLMRLNIEAERIHAPLIHPDQIELPAIDPASYQQLQKLNLTSNEVNPYQSMIIHHGFPAAHWFLFRTRATDSTDSGWTLTPDPGSGSGSVDETCMNASTVQQDVVKAEKTKPVSNDSDSLDDLFDDEDSTSSTTPNSALDDPGWPVHRFHLEHWLDHNEQIQSVLGLPEETILEFNGHHLIRVALKKNIIWESEA